MRQRLARWYLKETYKDKTPLSIPPATIFVNERGYYDFQYVLPTLV